MNKTITINWSLNKNPIELSKEELKDVEDVITSQVLDYADQQRNNDVRNGVFDIYVDEDLCSVTWDFKIKNI